MSCVASADAGLASITSKSTLAIKAATGLLSSCWCILFPSSTRIADLGHQRSSGILDACHHVGFVKGDQPGADVDRSGLRHVPMVDERELRRSASHVNIEDRLVLGLRDIHGAGTVGGEEGLVVVTRCRADEFSCILRKVLNDRLGVLLLESLASDDDRSRVDIFRLQPGLSVVRLSQNSRFSMFNGANRLRCFQ